MMTDSTALALPTSFSKASFKTDIARFEPELAKVTSKYLTPESITAAALHAAVHQPDLFHCTPQSLFLALARVARWGLEIGETVYLVPLTSKGVKVAEAWPDYRGLKALAIRQGLIRNMTEFVVYEGDEFEVQLGLEAILRHVPGPAKDRGPISAAYSIIERRFAPKTFHYLELLDIEKRRAGSRSWGPARVKECPPWYAMKTVVRDYLNRLPKTGAFGEAIAISDDENAAEAIEAADETWPMRPGRAARAADPLEPLDDPPPGDPLDPRD